MATKKTVVPEIDLKAFLDAAPTAYQAAGLIAKRLYAAGFTPLDEGEPWKLKKGEGYYVTRNGSAVLAFRMGMKNPAESGFKLVGSHTDSPLLKIKMESESVVKGIARVGIEVYGGPILATWLDRNLGIAGRVFVKKNGKVVPVPVRTAEPCALIPNLAIHMNREVNKGFEYNPQTHLQAIIGTNHGTLKRILADAAKVKEADILDADVYLYDAQEAVIFGPEGEYIVSGRLDNLLSAHASLLAIEASEKAEATAVSCFFDNEEIGSKTLMGADSGFTAAILDRITAYAGGGKEEYYRALSKSFLISSDVAHALHPNFSDKHDPNYAPAMNFGPVIKASAGYKYATTAETSVYFQELCARAKVPCQKIINRSDIPSGSTIGPMSSAALSIKTVDIGSPMWAMHSARETSGTRDHRYLTAAFKEFWK